MDYKEALKSTRTELELPLKDLFGFLEILFEDNRKLKLTAFAPDKITAKGILDYLSWEKGNARNNFEKIYKKELDIINEWLEIYCEEHNCSKEEALSRIIEE